MHLLETQEDRNQMNYKIDIKCPVDNSETTIMITGTSPENDEVEIELNPQYPNGMFITIGDTGQFIPFNNLVAIVEALRYLRVNGTYTQLVNELNELKNNMDTVQKMRDVFKTIVDV